MGGKNEAIPRRYGTHIILVVQLYTLGGVVDIMGVFFNYQHRSVIAKHIGTHCRNELQLLEGLPYKTLFLHQMFSTTVSKNIE